ncbi:DUF58 domain-containing protein [Alicyclobacillus cycloheptanicus]|uniref:Uncharacterized protein (DUF58 family) n=1 Tax=Alicyclobacillus cycloheptanicus TaxID=1457 RepID=A0ABT9XGK2_9BACL|nr:DUF58 domain-containing protein [Alicyclobacillus cycloheptanicus]MDQ0189434.1 uncharacterized protein (DUF58 family) [Alicyclobacillus cycloheptanicus]WDM02304.1 DUF58 domain-containing protein [Alicyclobacillus cycloheptanicus]
MTALCLLAFFCMVGVMVGWHQVWKRVVAPQVEAELEADVRSLPYGESACVTVKVKNHAWLPAPMVRCAIDLPAGLSLRDAAKSAAQSARVPEGNISLAVSLRPREMVKASYQVYGVARGTYRVTTLTLTLSDGLLSAGEARKLDAFVSFVVHPKKGRAPRVTEHMTRLGAVPSSRRRIPTSLDWVDVRPYQFGDSVRDIAWLLSARRNELIVVDRASSFANDAIVVVSAQVDRDYWAADAGTVDRVCEAAYAIIEQLIRQGTTVRLYTNTALQGKTSSKRHHLMTLSGRWSAKQDMALGHALGAIPVFSNARLEQVLQEVAREAVGPCPIKVVTAYWDDAIDMQVQRLRRRGHSVEVHALQPIAAAEAGRPVNAQEGTP